MFIKMANPILIHINRKYHIDLEKLLKVKQKKSGRVYVYYLDEFDQVKIAIAKQSAREIIHIINQYQTVLAKKPFILEKEFKLL